MKMRKLLCLVLSLLLVLSLAACGNDKEKKRLSYKDVAERYMDAVMDAHYAKIVKLWHPGYIDHQKA